MKTKTAQLALQSIAYARRCASVGRVLALNFDISGWEFIMTSSAVQVRSKTNAVSCYCHNDHIWFLEVAPGLFEITRIGL